MTYKPALVPWNHQSRANARAKYQAFFAWLMEMGTGKTKVCIDEFMELWTENLIDCVVIFAPKGVYQNWVRNELPMHIPEYLKGEVDIVPWYQGGGNSSQRNEIVRILEPSPLLRVIVVNTEAFSSGDKAYGFVLHFLASSKIGVYMAVDESTFIKSPTASRTKNIVQLGSYSEVKYRRIMTGSPVTRSPLDLYGQAEFLKGGLLGQSYFAFQARYAILKQKKFGNKRPVNIVVGYRNLDDLQERMKSWSFRVLKADCLDLPEKIYTRRDVELTDEQERVYREIRDYALSELNGGGTVSSDSVITRMLRLQQVICGHVKNDDGTLVDVPTKRVEAVMEIAEEAEGKIIIWSRFRPDVDRIVEALTAKYGEGAVAQFHGGNTETRHLDSERFVKDPNCRFMVATYAGGFGNTWIVANTVVYFSNDFSLEKRIQSEDRSHRGGQRNAVTYIDLVCPGTIDETVLKAIRMKIDLAQAVTGDNYREWII